MYVHSLARDLKDLGCDVTIVAPSNDEKEHTYIYDGLSVYRYPVSLKPGRLYLKFTDMWRGQVLRKIEVHLKWLVRYCKG